MSLSNLLKIKNEIEEMNKHRCIENKVVLCMLVATRTISNVSTCILIGEVYGYVKS